jgi:intracellular sulfur oxidation DsrE/DsrF family protein
MALDQTVASTIKMGLLLAAALVATCGPCLAQAGPAVTAPVPSGYYTFQRVVYQNDGGSPDNRAYFLRFMHNVGAHIAATNGQVEIRVVNFASGVTSFQLAKTDADLRAGLDRLRAKGVKFLICRNTLNGMGLKVADLYGVTEADVVPSGVAEIARLQGQGFVYIHP